MAKKKKESRFRGKTGADARRHDNEGSNYGYLKLPKGVSVFKPEEGRMKFDILPYIVTDSNHPDKNEEIGAAVEGEMWYKRPFKVHRNIGSGNDSAVCLTSFGKKCPICEYRTKRMKEGAEKEELDALKPSQRVLYVVIPKGHKKLEEIPHLLDVSYYLFQKLLNEELQEDDNNEVFPDLEEGLTLKVRFEEKKIGKNAFFEAARIDFEERDEPYDESILDEIPNLDEILISLSYKELELKFFELDEVEEDDEEHLKRKSKPAKSKKQDDDDEEEEEEEKPRHKKSARKPEPEEEEDDDDDEDDDDEEEEEPVRKYSKKAAKKPSKKVVKEEEEEDEDEEEEEKPKRTTKSSKKKSEPEEDEEEEEEDEKPVKKASKKESSKTGGKCPFKHIFGKDCDKHDDCDECDKWDECIEAQEN